ERVHHATAHTRCARGRARATDPAAWSAASLRSRQPGRIQLVVATPRLRGVAMGAPKRRRADLAGRAPMRSPGRPPVARREERQRFWAAIADGLSSEEAGVVAGVSPAVGVRWFREGGGMPS